MANVADVQAGTPVDTYPPGLTPLFDQFVHDYPTADPNLMDAAREVALYYQQSNRTPSPDEYRNFVWDWAERRQAQQAGAGAETPQQNAQAIKQRYTVPSPVEGYFDQFKRDHPDASPLAKTIAEKLIGTVTDATKTAPEFALGYTYPDFVREVLQATALEDVAQRHFGVQVRGRAPRPTGDELAVSQADVQQAGGEKPNPVPDIRPQMGVPS